MCEKNRLTVGVGVDMCAVSRMERAIEREHFYSRIFTERERAYLDKKNKGRAQSAAAIYAAKEAAVKALGTGLSRGIFFDQIEVTHDELGAPGLVLSGRALERMRELNANQMLLSLSHEGDMAIAFVVMQ